MQILTKKTADHVWSNDPAIDLTAAGCIEKYQAAVKSGDVSGLPLKEGHRPTVWKLQRLTRRLFLRLDGKKGIAADCEMIAYGLVGVENLEIDGNPVVLKFDKVDGVERLSPESLDVIFDPQLVNELAAHVILLSKLDPTSGQGS